MLYSSVIKIIPDRYLFKVKRYLLSAKFWTGFFNIRCLCLQQKLTWTLMDINFKSSHMIVVLSDLSCKNARSDFRV